MRTIKIIIVAIMLWLVVHPPAPAQSLIDIRSTQVTNGRIYAITKAFDSLSTQRWKTGIIDGSVLDPNTSFMAYSYHLYSPSADDTVKVTVIGYQDLTSTAPVLSDTILTIHMRAKTSTSIDSITYANSITPARYYPYWQFYFQRGVTAERDATLQFTLYFAGRKD